MIFKNSKLFLILLSFVSIILLAVLILETYHIQSKNKEASELLNLADQVAETEVLSQSIRMMQNSAETDITAFDNLTLSGDNIVPLIEQIEEVGKKFNLDITIVSVGKVEDKKSIEPDIIRIIIETKGSWASTLSFLRAIESLPHRVMIDESSFLKGEDSWRLKIILSLYSFD